MTVLGLDPGIASFGWAVIDSDGGPRLKLRCCGVIKTLPGIPLGERLRVIGGDLRKIITENGPEHAAIEEIFFAKNVKTATVVGHARGVAMFVCSDLGLDVTEFTPLEIKQALTGYGRATKPQIGFMVKKILNLRELPRDDNAVDAVAAGICFAHSHKNL